MTSPDNPFFKVSSGVDRTSRTTDPVKYGPVKETHKSKTDFRELLGAEERDPETAEEINKIKDKSKSSKKSGKSNSPVTSRSKVEDSDDSNLSIFDLQSKQKPKVAKEVVKFIKDSKAKVQASIQADVVRVS